MSTMIITGSRAFLKIYGSIVTQYAWNTGYVGLWKRSPGIGYSYETYLYFDVSSLVGKTISSVDLEITTSDRGLQVISQPSQLFVQNKSLKSVWLPGRAPKYNDFTDSEWPTKITEIDMLLTGTYTYPSNSTFVSTVNSWIADVNNNNGLVIDCNFSGLNFYLAVTSARLNVTYTESSIINTFLHLSRLKK